MSEPALVSRALQAAEAWGGAAEAPCLISHRENAVFRVRLRAGPMVALRLHRVGYHTDAAIEAELDFTDRLSVAGFRCPKPMRTEAGGWLCQRDGSVASAVAWIDDAKPIGTSGAPLDMPVSAKCDIYRRLGAQLADLHRLSNEIVPTPPARHCWDADGLLGDQPFWGCFWQNPALDREEARLLEDVRTKVQTILTDHGPERFGMIHADAILENVLRAGDDLWLIDFDDCGWGYRSYELGCALFPVRSDPDFSQIRSALVDGYGDPDEERLLDVFILLRALASCGWIVSRADEDSPKHRHYAERALTLSRSWLETGRVAP